MSKPVVMVAGLGRCGTSATMQALFRGGIPCVGDWPAFEVTEACHRFLDPAWLARLGGQALKWLDPHHAPRPRSVPVVVIWLDRDPVEQARSQAKFACAVIGAPRPARAEMRKWIAGLRRERTQALAAVGAAPLLRTSFEALLQSPERTTAKIAAFLDLHAGIAADTTAMAAAIRRRPSRCAPGLDVEIDLLDGATP